MAGSVSVLGGGRAQCGRDGGKDRSRPAHRRGRPAGPSDRERRRDLVSGAVGDLVQIRLRRLTLPGVGSGPSQLIFT